MSELDHPFPSHSAAIPMTFGQILDRIFRLMRSHYKPFVGIGIIPAGAFFAIYGLFMGALFLAGFFPHPPAHPNPVAFLWVVPSSLLFSAVALFIYGLYYAAASYAALQADHGLKVTVSGAFHVAWSNAGRYVWLLVLQALIVAIPILLSALAIIFGALLLGLVPRGNPSTAALFFLIHVGILAYFGSVVYAVIISLRLSLAYPACLQEDLTAVQAIKRSSELTKGAKGRIFLALLIIYAIGYAVILIFYAIAVCVAAIGALVGAGHIHAMAPWSYIGLGVLGLCAFIVILLWSVLLMAGYSTALAVFYRDQRLRRDGPPPAPAQPAEPA
jgi:hypothetical protein